MTGWLLISTVVLWVIVLGEGVLLLGALRQIGSLRRRLGPERPLEQPLQLADTRLDHRLLQPYKGLRRALLFVLPGCSACSLVLDGLRPLRRSNQVIIVIQSDANQAAAYLDEYGLSGMPNIPDPSGELASSAGIREFPSAAIVGPELVLERRGIVNSRDQLEALLAVDEAAVA